MNQLNKFINYRYLIYNKNPKLNSNFILSKDKNSPLSFIEITKDEYRFVFDKIDIKLLSEINNESKLNQRIDIQNLIWCGGGITIIYKYT